MRVQVQVAIKRALKPPTLSEGGESRKHKPLHASGGCLKRSSSRYREIQQLLGVSYTWVNRHVTEGRQALKHAEAAAEAEGASGSTGGRLKHRSGC